MSISIQVFEPLVKGGGYLFDVTGKESGYQHTIQALGGYWSASFTIQASQNEIEDWIDGGLGRHIEVYDEGQVKIWEGFVDSVDGNLGGLSVTRGPLMDVANRVSLVYSTVDTSTSPPTMGVRARTATVNDTDSQSRYGIIERVLSAGGVSSSIVEDIRDTYLAEHKEPQTSQQVNIGGSSSEASVTVNCLGYVHWLAAYTYSNTTTGTQNLSTKLQNILATDPNSIFSTDYSKITTNTLQVAAWENDDDVAWGLVKGLVAKGDASSNRYLFGIYNDRQARYEAMPTEIAYQQRLSDPEMRIETLDGQRVFPWNVLPGKWLFISDFLIGRVTASDLRFDPRALFIESVTYTAPWGLQVSGGKTDKLAQRLAQLGLSGVGS